MLSQSWNPSWKSNYQRRCSAPHSYKSNKKSSKWPLSVVSLQATWKPTLLRKHLRVGEAERTSPRSKLTRSHNKRLRTKYCHRPRRHCHRSSTSTRISISTSHKQGQPRISQICKRNSHKTPLHSWCHKRRRRLPRCWFQIRSSHLTAFNQARLFQALLKVQILED